MKSKFTWVLLGCLILITAVGVGYIGITVSRQSEEKMVISSEEFREYCEKYGLQNEAGYDDLDQLYAENSDKGSNDTTLYRAVETLLPEGAKLLELTRESDSYYMDYTLSESDGVYEKRVYLTYWEDGTIEIVLCQGNQIITVDSSLIQTIQYVS
jgi:hypothetical protein